MMTEPEPKSVVPLPRSLAETLAVFVGAPRRAAVLLLSAGRFLFLSGENVLTLEPAMVL